ncbi:hypothetical protein HNP84_006952 [Thermocatellispora tengchongensis]|uniref:Uncharacterized protein n=1 Tax=Thermocatellispora tengchongensis TaxID=1073253 RepID=A0A840PI29_9ACTN|nr:hypothetical protein [Thermocatellispora tengchongensis]MBB5137200.1 hypothetical protein [Thermocatellispora tengchongensis]
MAEIGVWLIGARGAVATTAAVGAAAIRSGPPPAQGCVTEAPGFWPGSWRGPTSGGRFGVPAEPGYFFKDPLGCGEHALAAQYAFAGEPA